MVNSYPLSICTTGLNGSKLIYSTQSSYNIIVQDIHEDFPSQNLLEKHKDTITQLLSIHNSNLLVSAGNDCLVVLWNTLNYEVLGIFDWIIAQITHLSLIPNEKEALLVIGYSRGQVACWNLNHPLYY